jgi:hypothetical protein
MLWATVPKAAVNKDSESLLAKREIGLSKKRRVPTPAADSVFPK